MEKLYLALTADLDDSRELSPQDRRRAQEALRGAIQQYTSMPFAPFVGPEIVAGDRVQLLTSFPAKRTRERKQAAAAIVQVVATTAAALVRSGVDELSMSYGLGVGSLHTKPDFESVGNNDGPCFHHAEDALLQEAKKAGLCFAARGWTDEESSDTERSGDQLALMAVFQSLCSQIYGWTARQAEFVHTSLPEGFVARDGVALAPALPRKEVAAQHGVNAPTVSKSLRAAQLNTVRHTAFAAYWMLASIPEPSLSS